MKEVGRELERRLDENYSIIPVNDYIEAAEYYVVTFRGNIIYRIPVNIEENIPDEVLKDSEIAVKEHKKHIGKFIDKVTKLKYVQVYSQKNTISCELFDVGVNILFIRSESIIDKEWSDYFKYNIKVEKNLFSKDREYKTYFKVLTDDDIIFIIEELLKHIAKENEIELSNQERKKQYLLKKIGMNSEQVEALMELLSMNVKISSLK